jgi:hypothetical protein
VAPAAGVDERRDLANSLRIHVDVEVHASDISREQRSEPALLDDRPLSSAHGSIPRVGNVVRLAVADEDHLVIVAIVTRGVAPGFVVNDAAAEIVRNWRDVALPPLPPDLVRLLLESKLNGV